MPHRARIRSELPPVLPPHLTPEECIACLVARVAWTQAQAEVALAGIDDRTCREIGAHLDIAYNTARAHYRDAAAWIGVRSREAVTARAVATLWQSVVDETRASAGGTTQAG